jgi:hypothetical protein
MMKKAKITQKATYVIDEKAGKKYWSACGKSKNQSYYNATQTKLYLW